MALNKKRPIWIYAGTTLLFAVLGILLDSILYDFLISKVETPGIELITTSVPSQWQKTTWLALCIALLPLLFGIGHAISQFNQLRPGVLLAVLILALGLVGINFHITQLIEELSSLGAYAMEGYPIQFDVQKLHFGPYLLAGFTSGALLGGFALRQLVARSKS